MKLLRFLPIALVLPFLTSCSSFSGTLFVPRVFYKISGNLSGLVGSGLMLLDDGASNLSVAAGTTSFTFGKTVASGGRYDVTVTSQPSGPWQTCAVTNGSGSVGTADITNVQITCTTNTYTVGGDTSTLTGTGLVLQDNGGDNLAVSPDSSGFTFAARVASGDSYNVTILSQPSGQICTLSNGRGTVAGANVTGIHASCVTYYSIGGTISGLTGAGLVLQDNNGDNLSISSGATTFTFNTPIASGGSYSVTILSEPSSPSQTCNVADGSGPVTNANITSVQIVCPTVTFAYVSNQDNTISAYLVSADGALTALPSSPFPGGNNPAGLAVDPSGKFLYVANVLGANVSGYAIASDGALSPIPGSPFPAASGAISVAIEPTGKFLYVPSCGADCSGSGAGAIAAFSITPGTGVLVPVPGSPFTAGTYPYAMAFVTPGATGTFAYVANHRSDNISGFSIQPNGALSAVSGSPFAAGTTPLALAVDQAFNRLYAVNTGSSTVSAYSVHVDGSLVQFSTIGTGAFTSSAVVDTNEHLYVAAALSGVFGFETSTFPATPIAGSPFAAGLGPNAVRIDPSGKFLYVVNEGAGSVSGYSINSATGQLTPTPGSSFATGALPYSIAFSAPPSTPVAWYLNDVQFSNGDTASGSFTYDASRNTVTNINVVAGSTTYTQLASTFPVHPFEFVFVPSGTLTFGVPEPALVLFPAPFLTNAGGSVSLTGANGISVEGLICKDACDDVGTSSQSQSGSSLSSTPPAQ
jgi:6-phosphogluconolactonase (cycloisomerase 2 family)